MRSRPCAGVPSGRRAIRPPRPPWSSQSTKRPIARRPSPARRTSRGRARSAGSLTAVIEGGATVVGFDIVFPTSIEQSEIPFGDETLGERAARIRPRLPACARGRRPVRQDRPRPDPASGSSHPALARSARGRRADAQHPRPERLHGSRRRRAPPSAHVLGRGGNEVPSMAVELASRAHGGALERTATALSRWPAIGSRRPCPNTMTLNFEGGADDIPTYSLADLRACAERRDTAFFRRHFGGKVVLVGTVLDAEDRKLTSKRFATAPEGAGAPTLCAGRHAIARQIRAGFDCRRVCACDGGQQSHPARRADRIWSVGARNGRRRIGLADRDGRIRAGAGLGRPCLSVSRRRMDRRRHHRVHAGAGGSALGAVARRPARARRDDRLPLRHGRQGRSACCDRRSGSISRRRSSRS